MILTMMALVLILFLSGPSRQGDPQEIGISNENLEREFIFAPQRQKRATVDHSAAQTDKCSYTFIVPQQKKHGVVCVNSKEPETLLENRVSKQDMELLTRELQRQRQQIDALQQLVEIDGGVVSEVKLLHKESRNMNSRVTQLYMQLLHEIIRKRDDALEAYQLEMHVLNHTNEMDKLAARYRNLEHRYQLLSTLADNQNALLVQLEERCRRPPPSYHLVQERSSSVLPHRPLTSQPSRQMPDVSAGGYRPFHPPTRTRHTNPVTNEIQSDQNSKALPSSLPTMESAAYSFTKEFSGK